MVYEISMTAKKKNNNCVNLCDFTARIMLNKVVV